MKSKFLLALGGGLMLAMPAGAVPSGTSAPFLPINSAVNTFNLSPQFFNNEKTAIANAYLGLGRNRICFVGDSTTLGVNSSAMTYQDTKSAVFADALNRAGIPTRTDSVFLPQNNTFIAVAPVDQRVTIGSGWAEVNATLQAASSIIQATSAAGNITFTPVDSVDTFNVWYHGANTGSFTIQIDSGTAQTVTSSTNGLMHMASITGVSPGAHTLTIAYVSGNVQLGLIEAYDSTVNDTSVINVAVTGLSTTTALNLPGQNHRPDEWQALACNMYILNLGINDELQSIPLATSYSNLNTYIPLLENGGLSDVVLEAPQQTYHTITPRPLAPVQAAYTAQLYGIAAQNNLPLVDLYGTLGSFSTESAYGWIGVDGLHPTYLGYDLIGEFEFQSLRRVLGY